MYNFSQHGHIDCMFLSFNHHLCAHDAQLFFSFYTSDFCNISDHVRVLGKLRDKLKSTIEAQDVACYMHQHQFLTWSDLELIQCERNKPSSAGDLMLGIVIKQLRDVYDCFLDALDYTGQQRLRQLIETEDLEGIIQKSINTLANITF